MVYISPRIATQVNKPNANIKFSVIIPGAGLGSRMKGKGAKPLIKIKNTTIIENQLKHIRGYLKSDDIILVGGFEIQRVKEYVEPLGVRVVENEDFLTTNVTKSISIGLDNIRHKDVIIIYGDLVFNAYTLKVPLGGRSAIIYDSYGYMSEDEIGCTINKMQLENMMYGIPNKWAQITYFTGKELVALKELCCIHKNHQCFGFEIINEIMANGGSFICYSPKKMKIRDVDTPKDLKTIEDMMI